MLGDGTLEKIGTTLRDSRYATGYCIRQYDWVGVNVLADFVSPIYPKLYSQVDSLDKS